MKLFSLLLGAALVSGAAAAGCTACPANALTCAADATGTLTAITCKAVSVDPNSLGYFAKTNKSGCTACANKLTKTCSSATVATECKATLDTATGVYLDASTGKAACTTCGTGFKSCADGNAANVGGAVKTAVCLKGFYVNQDATTCTICAPSTGPIGNFVSGTYTCTVGNAVASGTCKPGFVQVAVGNAGDDVKCVECTGGKFDNAGGNADGGALCASTGLTVPTKCSPGYYMDSATCTKCVTPNTCAVKKGFVGADGRTPMIAAELCPAGSDGYSSGVKGTSPVAVACPNTASTLTDGGCTPCHDDSGGTDAMTCTAATGATATKCYAGAALVSGKCVTAAFNCPAEAKCGASIGNAAIAKIYTKGNVVGQLTEKTGCTMIAGATCKTGGVTTEAKSYALTCKTGFTKTTLAACPAGWYKKMAADVPDAVTCMADCHAVNAADGPCMCGTAKCAKLDKCAAADKTANKCKKPVQATKKSPASTMQASALLSAAALLVAMRQ